MKQKLLSQQKSFGVSTGGITKQTIETYWQPDTQDLCIPGLVLLRTNLMYINSTAFLSWMII
jgi:hypothetical protein